MAPPKKKAEKMAIGTFLQDQSLGSWADEMEEQGVMPLPPSLAGKRPGFSTDRASTFGSSSDRFAGYSSISRPELPLPTRPPYTAHIGNLSFDVTDREIKDYFGDCDVTSVRVVEDKIDHKPKGFGYIEFATVDGLKKALELNETQFANRKIRVSVADPPKDREDRGSLDWSRKAGPLPDLPQSERRFPERKGFGDRSFSRNLDAASDAGSDKSERRRAGFGESTDGKVRDFSNWERKGPLQPLANEASSPHEYRPRSKEGFDRFNRRDSPRGSPQLSDNRSFEGGSRPPRREFRDRPQYAERPPTAAEQDSDWRKGARPDKPPSVISRENSTPSSPALPNSTNNTAPTTRPKLNLAKRSEHPLTNDTTSPSSDAVASKPSPFGAAKPADTASRDKAAADRLEEKKQEAIRERQAAAEKKIADDRAALDKKLADRAEKLTLTESKASTNGEPLVPQPESGAHLASPNAHQGQQEQAREVPADRHAQAQGDLPNQPEAVAAEDPADVPRQEEGWTSVKAAKRSSRAPALARPIAS